MPLNRIAVQRTAACDSGTRNKNDLVTTAWGGARALDVLGLATLAETADDANQERTEDEFKEKAGIADKLPDDPHGLERDVDVEIEMRSTAGGVVQLHLA